MPVIKYWIYRYFIRISLHPSILYNTFRPHIQTFLLECFFYISQEHLYECLSVFIVNFMLWFESNFTLTSNDKCFHLFKEVLGWFVFTSVIHLSYTINIWYAMWMSSIPFLMELKKILMLFIEINCWDYFTNFCWSWHGNLFTYK